VRSLWNYSSPLRDTAPSNRRDQDRLQPVVRLAYCEPRRPGTFSTVCVLFRVRPLRLARGVAANEDVI
jgi:hypothetical protein